MPDYIIDAWTEFAGWTTGTFLILIPVVILMYLLFYNSNVKTKSFYGKLLGVESINLMTKNHCLWYITWTSVSYMIPLIIRLAMDLPTSLIVLFYFEDNFPLILLSIWLVSHIVPYLIILTVVLIFMRKKDFWVSDQIVVDWVKVFVENWKRAEYLELKLPEKELKLQKKFRKKQLRSLKNIGHQKRIRRLESKTYKMYNDKDWNKFISILSSYLYVNYLNSKKMVLKLDEIDKTQIKKIIINDFLYYNFG